MCVCVYSNAQKRLPEPPASFQHWRTSREGQGSLMSTVTIHSKCLMCKAPYDGDQLVRSKHPTLSSPQRHNSRKKGPLFAAETE